MNLKPSSGLFTLVLTVFCLNFIQAQNFYRLSGTVVDASSGEPLIGASVIILDNNDGIATNNYGYYSLNLPASTYTVEVSYLGFKPLSLIVELDQNLQIPFALIPETSSLEEVVITGTEKPNLQREILSGVSTLKVSDIQKLPVLFGEPDLNRVIINQAGVSSVGDGASGFNVRGGNIDQNLILLDEAPIYNSAHLWGFFSVFNSDAIKNVKLYKGGIPARYGGRGSSVLDVRQREGNNQRFTGQGGIGLLFSRLTLEGPIQKDKLSFLVSGRRSYFDLAPPKLTGMEDSSVFFYDLSTKLSWIINDKNRLYASGYFGSDVLRFTYEDTDTNNQTTEEVIDFEWGNATTTLRWNHLFSDQLFMNVSAIYSQYNYRLNSENDSGGGPVNTTGSFVWSSNNNNLILKPDFTYYQHPDLKWRFGFNSTLYQFRPAKVTSVETGINSVKFPVERGLELAPYVEYDRQWEKLSLLAGVRYSWFGNLGPYTVLHYDPDKFPRVNTVDREEVFDSGEVTQSYSGIEPRLALQYKINERKSVKIGYDRNFQYIHLISNTTAALPFDIWKPAGKHIKPLEVNQLSAGYAYTAPENRWNGIFEVFYKDFKNLVEYRNGADLFLNDQLETQLLPAEGRAYGLEMSLKKETGKWQGAINYTYSLTERRTTSRFTRENLRNGAYFPSNYDRPHALNITVNRPISRKWKTNLFFTYQSGRPITAAIGQFQMQDNQMIVYSDRNAYRLPDLHRLDFSVNYTPKPQKEKGWQGEWSFGVYNLYGGKNVFSRYSNFLYRELKSYEFSAIGAPIPFINYNFKF